MTNEPLLSLRIPEEDNGKRAQSVLHSKMGMTAGEIRRLKHGAGIVMLDNRKIRCIDEVTAGGILTVRFTEKNEGTAPTVALVSLVRYEDEWLTVLDKPANMATHSGEGTLETLWRKAFPDVPFRPLNRLDKDTSGLLIAAKNPYAADRLRRSLHTPSFYRIYLAAAIGEILLPGMIDFPISPLRGGEKKSARTLYTPLALENGRTLAAVRLLTGRTHQIRIHFAGIGHPLAGDVRYGVPEEGIARQALHSAVLCFTHPVTEKTIRIHSVPPADFCALFPAFPFAESELEGLFR